MAMSAVLTMVSQSVPFVGNALIPRLQETLKE